MSNHPFAKEIIIREKIYPTITAAAEAEDVCRRTIRNHLKSKSLDKVGLATNQSYYQHRRKQNANF